jgi:cytochrome P450
MVFSDPPEHHPKRSLCLPLVSRSRLTVAEPLVRELVDGLIDDFIERGEAEFKSEFADPLPSRVVFRLLGVPDADFPSLQSWLDEDTRTLFVHAPKSDGSDGSPLIRSAESGDGRAKARKYFEDLIQDRVERPEDDFVSDLVRAKVERDGGELDLYYLGGELTNLYGAGTFTTSLMIVSTLLLLLEHPEQLARVQADQALLRPAIDESLRVESPVQWLQRYVTQDTVLQGVEIPQGSVVLLAWASGNRDPRRFDDPERFIIDRERVAKDQLAFGRGAHLCLGAPVARLEGRVAFEQLFARLRNIRLSDRNDYTHLRSVKYRAPAALHIEFDRV